MARLFFKWLVNRNSYHLQEDRDTRLILYIKITIVRSLF